MFNLPAKYVEAMTRIGHGYSDAYENGLMADDIQALVEAGYITTVQYGAQVMARITPLGRAILDKHAAPDAPAQVDAFLFGKDVTMKRLQAHELHESDGTTLDDKDARIQQLEAIIASHQNSLSQEAHKSEQLQALLNEVAQVLTPIKYACDDDWVRREIPDNELLQVYNGEENQVLHLIHVNDGLRMEHLRAVVAVAEKLNAALKK